MNTIMNTEEKLKIKHFIKEYNEIFAMADLMQKSIESLAKKRDDLFDKAEDLKIEERKFIDDMIKKYGPKNVTPNKLLEIINEDIIYNIKE